MDPRIGVWIDLVEFVKFSIFFSFFFSFFVLFYTMNTYWITGDTIRSLYKYVQNVRTRYKSLEEQAELKAVKYAL